MRTADFYKYQTGVGINIMIMTLIAFIVGLSISGQTFYTFILENLEKFGALKAIGAKGHELVAMILFQAIVHRPYGLWAGRGTVLVADRSCQVAATQLCRDGDVLQPGFGLRDGHRHHRVCQLHRHPSCDPH